jgi:hypothetical protein
VHFHLLYARNHRLSPCSPSDFLTSAQDWGPFLMFEGKSCSPFRSYTHLVIKAHQHSTLKTSIRSNSDSWKCLHSSARAFSPRLCKSHLSGHLPPMISDLYQQVVLS